jgi:hypothetical protein
MVHEFSYLKPLNKQALGLLALACIVSAGLYLSISGLFYRIGFPLDDAWIHLTYARNLAEYGEWAFQPGYPSGGSTSPLWTVLLSIGFITGLAPYILTYILGIGALLGISAAGELIARNSIAQYRPRIPWIGLFLAVEWHLVWAAMSGMETLLHACLITLVLGMLMVQSRRFLVFGLLVGISVWSRPDGITLLGPLILFIVIRPGIKFSNRLRDFFMLLFGLLVLFLPYVLFNLLLSGTPLPNTFYAKQAEYISWQSLPMYVRFGQLVLQLCIGPSIALMPGVLIWGIALMRERNWGALAGMVWFAAYVLLYVFRLPVYQHARYIIPAMPVFFLWGLFGLIACSKMINEKTDSVVDIKRKMLTSWRLLVAALCVVFWIFGAQAYAQDVAFIESEMVVTAKWVAENVPPGKLIAAHDIGALGYFDNHRLLDLAGLVSPEVIPFMRDETQLSEYLDMQEVSYFIAFPQFYPLLSGQSQPVFTTGSQITKMLGGENMVVYRWR